MKTYLVKDVYRTLATITVDEKIVETMLDACSAHYREECSIRTKVSDNQYRLNLGSGATVLIILEEMPNFKEKNYRYVLFGRDACEAYEEGGVEKVLARYEANELSYDLAKYDVNDPATLFQALIDASRGSSEYANLSEQEYERLN